MYDKRQLKQSPTKCRDVVFKNNVMGLATSRMICLQKNNKSDERLLFLYPVEWTNPEDQNTTRASRRVASRRCGSPHCRSVEKKQRNRGNMRFSPSKSSPSLPRNEEIEATNHHFLIFPKHLPARRWQTTVGSNDC